MTAFHNLFSFIDVALLASLVFVWAGGKAGLGLPARKTGVAIIAVACLVPVAGLQLFMYPRALVGDLGMTSKALGIAWLLYRLEGPTLTDMKEIRVALYAMTGIGLVFYPLALGLTPFDPYAAGYSASVAIVWTIVAVAWCLQNNYMIIATGLLAGLWGYLFGIMESDNLFDYLFDPVLFFYAAGFTCVTLLKNRKTRGTADPGLS